MTPTLQQAYDSDGLSGKATNSIDKIGDNDVGCE